MSERLSEREKIIKSLTEIMPCNCIAAYKLRSLSAPDCPNCNYVEEIADFILAEKRRIVEPLNEGFEAVKGMRSKNFILSIYRDAMVKALKRANGGE